MNVGRATTRSAISTFTAPDAAGWAERVLGGTSLVVAGPRGSGRSRALAEIATEIACAGGTPLEVRTASSLSSLPFSALDAADHRALRLLREDPVELPLVDGVLLVDDVELLDVASMNAVARAVASRRLTAVFALRTPRSRALEPDRDEDEVRRGVRDLLTAGIAQRIDLTSLSPADAATFIAESPGAHLLDDATRAGLAWRADGSRALLRQLVLRAVDDAKNGRDPLLTLRDIAHDSPLAVVLERHVAEFSPRDLTCLAGIRRLPRLETAVATRLFDRDSIEALLASGLLHADSSAQRRLTVNDLVASEAERRIGASIVDELIDAAGRRMLAEADEWWSGPVAVTLARRWHRLGAGNSDESAYPAALRARVALDAARDANDRGDAAHAAAHAARGRKAADTALLRLEIQLAGETGPASSSREVRDGVDAELRRRIARSLAECEGRAATDPPDPERALADSRVEELLSRSAHEGAHLDWAAAAETAGLAVAQSAATAAARLRSLVMAGTAEAVAGRWRRARTYYRGAERMLDARSSPEGLGARDRLAAVMFMLAGHQIAGADGTGLRARLVTETTTTAREGDKAELTLAGAAAAIAYAGSGQAVESQRELESAMARTPSAVTDPDATMIELGVAEELAIAGKLDDARAILIRLDDLGLPLLRRSRLYVQTTVLEAEGSHAAARNAARAAADLTRGTSAAALRIRDLFRLTALGAATENDVDELIQLAAAVDLPLTADAVRRASARSSAQVGLPVDELRLHALWSTNEAATRRRADAADTTSRQKDRSEGWGMLTAREREIAIMANAGLTNREIALRLFLSVRTVESHVYQARAKVGASSRRELGRMVASSSFPDDARDTPDGELTRRE